MAKNPDETNPFVQSLVIPAIWKLLPTQYEQGGITMKAKPIDKAPRCSVYTDGMMSWFPHLSTGAKDMVLWIMEHLPYEQDYMEMSEERYCSDMQVSKSSFYAAKGQLVNRLIIPRQSRRNTYWVSPGYLYKGSRVNRFKDRVVYENENPLARLGKGSADAQEAQDQPQNDQQ